MDAKRRRIVLAAAVAAIAAGAAGAAVALSSSGTRLDRASFPGYAGISFRYPSAWRRVDWCWTGTVVSPMALFTTAQPLPACVAPQLFSTGTPFPPPERLGPNGVAVWWLYTDRSGLAHIRADTRIGGRPAHLAVTWRPAPKGQRTGPRCAGGGPERRLEAEIQVPGSSSARLEAGGLICGPHYAAGQAAVRRMLASVGFAH
ncbi:MAG: hypothetical protein ACJ75G_09530 [Gaiellaceae bacterium]